METQITDEKLILKPSILISFDIGEPGASMKASIEHELGDIKVGEVVEGKSSVRDEESLQRLKTKLTGQSSGTILFHHETTNTLEIAKAVAVASQIAGLELNLVEVAYGPKTHSDVDIEYSIFKTVKLPVSE